MLVLKADKKYFITRRAEITGRCDYEVFGFFDHGVRPPVSRR